MTGISWASADERVHADSPLGWPDRAAPSLGGRLALMPGVMVFVPVSSGTYDRLAGHRRGFTRASAVGWPRTCFSAGTPRPETDGGSGAPGVTGGTSKAGRDGAVQDYGVPDQGSDAETNDVSRGTWTVTGVAAVPGSDPPSGDTAADRPTAAGNPDPAPVDPMSVDPAPVDQVGESEPASASDPAGSDELASPGLAEVYSGDGPVEDVGSLSAPTASDDDPPLAMEAMRAVQVLNPSGEVMMPRPSHPRVMAVANQKGGVGKTTTAVNLAVALALHGNRVIVVDLDPQGNASTGLNVPHHAGVPDVYDCLVDTVALGDVAQSVEGIPNLACVPATIDLAGAEIELVSVVARESRLARTIAAYSEEYDYIFVDCPPSLGLLTVNALVAAREVLIPIQCEYYALEGLNQLLNNINMVRAHLNPALEITTILLTMYDRRTRLADAVEQDVRNHFGDKVLEAVIPRNVRVSEAPSYGQSVVTYDPGSRGATSYFGAAQEIAERGAKLGDLV